MQRTFTILDRFLGEINRAINVLAAPAIASRALPTHDEGEIVLRAAEAKRSARLMRVNHAGEVSAQALYQGQALVAADPAVARAMRQAAGEEMDHLAWCELRIKELNGRTSLLNPLWYVGSFAIGALAGARGDPMSLGFIAETEKQVEAHLKDHGDRLPVADHRSRAIIERMMLEEAAHGANAVSLGGQKLPVSLRWVMRLTSKLMTKSSYWV